MNITFADNGIILIDDARIVYRNFSGEGGMYNREGDRNFSVVIPSQEIADKLVERGWNVKVRPPRDEDEEPFITMKVKVKFSGRGPSVYVRSGAAMNRLDERTVGMIDDMDIENVDLDIRPYDWETNGRSGRTAYLNSMCVTQRVDRFMERYNQETADTEPF